MILNIYLASIFIVRISSTFSVLRPCYFGSCTSTFFSKLDLSLVEKYRLKYSFGRTKVSAEVKFESKIGFRSKYRKGRTDIYL